MIAAACASAATEVPSSFVSIAGPCYDHDVLYEKLQADGFDLIATARSVNGTGVEATAKFYKLDDKFHACNLSNGGTPSLTGDISC